MQVVGRDLPIDRLPPSLINQTLVQISDLHIGPVVDEAYMTRAMKRVSLLKADILAITGDFMTYDGDAQIERTVRVLQHLQRGRLATLAVLGNHDYGPGWSQPQVAQRLTRRLENLGIRVLRNTKFQIEGLWFVGIDDLWSPAFAPELVMPTVEPDRPAVVLCHNPDAADLPVWSGYRGWILCGHTHGGQCRPPFGSPPRLPVKNKRYAAGEIDLHDGRRLYVNRGLGYLRRVRFNVRPEITAFKLTRTQSPPFAPNT